jgi:hypothetical protein
MTMTPKVTQDYGTESVAFGMTAKTDEIEGGRVNAKVYRTWVRTNDLIPTSFCAVSDRGRICSEGLSYRQPIRRRLPDTS